MAIESDSVAFTIKVIGESSLETWLGEFKAKTALTHRDHLKKDAMRRELLGPAPGASTDRALTTAEILGDLSVRLVKTPKWWQEANGGIDLVDDNILGAVYEAAIKIEKDAAEEKKKKAEEAQKAMREEAKTEAAEAK